MMEYKGYLGRVEFDDRAGIFHGEVVNTRDVITFRGSSVNELRETFRDSVDDYLEFCKQRGEDPEKPYSGRFVARFDPELHRRISIAASRSGMSLNAWVREKMQEAIEDLPVPKAKKGKKKSTKTQRRKSSTASKRR